MIDDEANPPSEPAVPAEPSRAEQDKRVAARRRFLRAGAAGSTTLVVTVMHQRAFAKGKKATVASAACGSLKGTPDLTKAKGKKLQLSALGTPKGLICRPRPPAPDPNPVGNCTPGAYGSGPNHLSKYANETGAHFPVVSGTELNKGCGPLYGPGNTIIQTGLERTVAASYNDRLYEEGFCPLTYNTSTHVLGYDTTKVYYTTNGDGSIKAGPIACAGP